MGVVVLISTSFLMGASVHASIMFDGLYMNYLGGTELLVGLLFGLTAFAELPTMHYSGGIIRRLSGPKALLLAYGLFITAFVGYTLARQPWMLLLMGIVKGLGFGLFYVSTVRLLTERTPEHWASTIQSILITSAFGLAPLLASPLGGEIYDRFGPKTIFLGTSLLVAGAALILLIAIIRGVFADSTSTPRSSLDLGKM
jgi:MFS family permease